MYNFKKIRNEFGETEFNHKWFRKGGKYINRFDIL